MKEVLMVSRVGLVAGSNVIVAGTALFGAEDPAAVITGFKTAISESKPVWGMPAALEDK